MIKLSWNNFFGETARIESWAITSIVIALNILLLLVLKRYWGT